jgi:hypothetical protein
MRIVEHGLFRLAKALYRTEIAHSSVAVARRRGCPARQPPPKEGLGLENSDHHFLAPRGDDHELHLSALELRDVSGPAHCQTWAGSLRADRPAVAP